MGNNRKREDFVHSKVDVMSTDAKDFKMDPRILQTASAERKQI
jgi:hypothetical protein